MFERFTESARRTISAAVAVATETGATRTAPEHLLLGLAADDRSTGARILAGYGITAAMIRAAVTGPDRQRRLTADEVAALRAVDADLDEVFRRIEQEFGSSLLFDQPRPAPRPGRRGWLSSPLDPGARKVLELCLREAVALRHREISSGHLLLALLRHGLPSRVSTALRRAGVTYGDARRRVIALHHPGRPAPPGLTAW